MQLLSGDRLAQTEKLIHTLLQPSGLNWAFSPATFPFSQDSLLFFKWQFCYVCLQLVYFYDTIPAEA